MPDKSKRRKNNKNKRKNKNNNRNNNVNKSNSDINDASSINSCDCQDETLDDGCENNQNEIDIESKSNTTESENNITKPVEISITNEHLKSADSNEQPLDSKETFCVNTATNIVQVEEVSGDLQHLNLAATSEISLDPKGTCIDNDLIQTQKNTDIIQIQEALDECQHQSDAPSKFKLDCKETLCVPNITSVPQMPEVTNDSVAYVVEIPDVQKKIKSKLSNNLKSKSVDNDEFPTIVEITDEVNKESENEKGLPVVDNTNILITDVDSDVEWENMDELHEISKPVNLSAEAFSVTTIPLVIAQCEQAKSLSPEEEKSLRCYLQGLNLTTSPSNLNSLEVRTEIEQIINREIKHRLRKKGFTEDIYFQRGNISRGLDVIDEEGSGESSATSRRHSYLSDKKSDNDELEDEVFEKKSIAAFKSNTFKNTKAREVIPQQCILVDAKLKEPEITEARGDWSLKTVEKITGAEVVYLTDSSSSTSSLYDVADDVDNDEASDASIRIITPTIEVTDTEKFLKSSFISKDKENLNTVKKLHNDDKNNINDEHEKINKVENSQITQNKVVNQNTTEHPHEIVVLSTEDIKTNLFVKDINSCDIKPREDDPKTNVIQYKNNLQETSKKENNTYDLEIKVLKCELNDAINNLIKEVTSDSEIASESYKETYTRQDSSSSVCSSQCTAKYNPDYSSLNDVSNIVHDDSNITHSKHTKQNFETNDITSHVKEVFQCVTGNSIENRTNQNNNNSEPFALRDLCVKKIASFPFGNKILEELAHVSERLQSMSILALKSKGASEFLKEKITEKPNNEKHTTKMPYYPLPDLSNIEQVALSTKNYEQVPPPVQPRNSSLKKSQDDQQWTAIPTTTDPLYVCLSPSQKMLMEKTNTVIRKEDASQLIETHKKFIDRRGYTEKLNDKIDSTPIVPFKSQTGSRLLALIRDPSVKNNVSLSSSQKHIFKSVESLPKLSYLNKQEHIERKNSTPNLQSNSKSFKPIPPPRPRKFSSSFYESDESSDFTDNSFRSIRSEKKIFHYSTGNLNKEIENDISSIQNMHRYYSNMRDVCNDQEYPRRPSLPKDLCEQQMEYIRRKEKEVEEEIQKLERDKLKYPERKGPRAPLISDEPKDRKGIPNDFVTSKRDILFSETNTRKEDKGKLSSVFSKSQEELLREKMYSEYVTQMAEREQRRQQKFIKISYTPTSSSVNKISKSMPTLDALDSKVNNRIEKEFISRARERWHKLGIEDPETDDEKELSQDIYREPKVIEHKIKVIQAGEEKDVTKLPSHLQEFVSFTARTKDRGDGRTGESEPEPEPAHVVVFSAVIILVLAVGKFFLRFFQNK